MSEKTDAAKALETSRQELESALTGVRNALQDSLGMDVRHRAWLLPLLAAAAGFALALGLRSHRRRPPSQRLG